MVVASRVLSEKGGSVLKRVDYNFDAPLVVGTEFKWQSHSTPVMLQASSVMVWGSEKIYSNIDGVRYQTEIDRNTDPSSSSFSAGQIARLKTEADGPGLPSPVREAEFTYVHNRGSWILGLPETVTQNGRQSDRYVYDPSFPGRVKEHYRFGTRVAQFGYHTEPGQQGALHWHKDALDRQTYFLDWKRGVPGQVKRADGTILRRSVDDHGQVTSFTDGKGVTTGYEYNSVGWLKKIDRPGTWADTTIYYDLTDNGYGAMFQDVRRGNRQDVTWYDGLLRPTLVRTKDSSDTAGTQFYRRTTYDGMGRVHFQGAPSTSSSDTVFGTHTSYDALGRIKQVRENVAPYATTSYQYLSGNRVKVTDPEGNVTTTTRVGFGSPDDGYPTLIQQPEGVNTSMAYDQWGNMLTARQYGTSGGYSGDVTQTYRYDSKNRLCYHHAPERGAKLYRYNHANELTGYSEGNSASSSGCPGLTASRTVELTYTILGQPWKTLYPDTTPDITRVYDANGNIEEVYRGTTQWSYRYEYTGTEDVLDVEQLKIDGLTFRTDYSINSLGDVTSQTLPGGHRIELAPNALGQPTKAQKNGGIAYASNMKYHPSGLLSDMNLGNGRGHSTKLNQRQLVERSFYSGGFTMAYQYDRNGRILSVDDLYNEVSGDRTFTYDGLGRLKTAQGPWGAGGYDYDPVNNLRRKTLGSTSVELDYNGLNQLSRFKDTREGNVWQSLGYDQRGNVELSGMQSWGGAAIDYDLSNQPINATPLVPGSTSLAAEIKDGPDGFTRYRWGPADTAPPSTAIFEGTVAKMPLQDDGDDNFCHKEPLRVRAGKTYTVSVNMEAKGYGLPSSVDGPKYALWIYKLDSNFNIEGVYGERLTSGSVTFTPSSDGWLRSCIWRNGDFRGNGYLEISDLVVTGPGMAAGGSATTTYVYDGNFRRVKQLDQDGRAIYSVYGLAGSLLHQYDVGQNERTDYVSAGGKSVARVTNGEVTYTYTDHLGSQSVLAGSEIGAWATVKEVLTPYGEVWSGLSAANDNQPGFTGHVRDKATGLTYMQARYYDPKLGRFLSTDPVQFSPARPDMHNRYAYVANDPINNYDPDGRLCVPCVTGGIGAVVGGGVEAYKIHRAGGDIFSKDGLKQIGRGALIGGAAGVTGSFAGAGASAIGKGLVARAGARTALRSAAPKALQGAGNGAVAGATAAGTQDALTQQVETGSIDLGQVGENALVGAATGLLGGAVAGQVEANAASRAFGDARGTALFRSQPGVGTGAITGETSTSALNTVLDDEIRK
jgi:RHS repeat-associated protein